MLNPLIVPRFVRFFSNNNVFDNIKYWHVIHPRIRMLIYMIIIEV